MTDNTKGLDHLITIVARLRAKDGCPWDRKQTPHTIKSYLLEETHEALAAVDSEEPDAVREELGDLLFLIVFLCQQYQEKGHFNMADALATINEKMTRRHPHVFGGEPTASEEELRDNWLAMKKKEKNDNGNRSSPFSSIPKTLPALKRAQRISEIAAHRGFDWSDLTEVFAKLEEETAELKQAVETGTAKTVFEEFGDILLVLVNIGRMLRVKPEEALNAATGKFIERYERMEQEITRSGQSLNELDNKRLLSYWQAVKNN
jgi:tetrapyrrole methylase family protein/MazG family protein/ATP diphosphatase